MPLGTGPELREERHWLSQQGFSWSLIQNSREKFTWYKPDGTALPNLPADPYHMKRYRARGWTLVPPELPTIPQDAINQLQEQVTAAAELLDSGDEGATPVAPHQHSFNRAMGSPCRTVGCTTVRTREYRTRAK
jgi:hypothetical protein